jgi:hypothetical protein
MTTQLQIRDGTPDWWTSPDIWVVPGTDPNGVPGMPIAGQNAYTWARVANTSAEAAHNVRVDFYWADPSTQILSNSAHFIGSAYADIDANDTQEVLCLVPWMPTIVNDGHECLIAVAHGSNDDTALPDPLPNGFDFNPPSYLPIAQRNLSVLLASGQHHLLAVTVAAAPRADKRVHISAEAGVQELSATTLATLGLKGLRPARKSCVRLALSAQPGCDNSREKEARAKLALEVQRNTHAAVYVGIDCSELEPGCYETVNVSEHDEFGVLGGLTLIVVSPHSGATS